MGALYGGVCFETQAKAAASWCADLRAPDHCISATHWRKADGAGKGGGAPWVTYEVPTFPTCTRSLVEWSDFAPVVAAIAAVLAVVWGWRVVLELVREPEQR